jgi:hypothetical protein
MRAAVPAIAGIQLGWEQALDKLTKTLGAGKRYHRRTGA